MAIIRITRKHIEEAHKAREAALKSDPEFRLNEELRRQLQFDARAAREREPLSK